MHKVKATTMSRRGHQPLNEVITSILSRLSKLSKNKDLSDLTQNPKFLLGLNYKIFSQITTFLMMIIDKKHSTKLPLPGHTPKDKQLFINALLLVTNEVKKENPEMMIPISQKSHFLDPRVESDKVMSFLLGLASSAAFVFTNSSKNTDLKTLRHEVEELEQKTLECQNETRRLLEENEKEVEKNLLMPKKMAELKEELLQKRIVHDSERSSLQDLLDVKEAVDAEHLQVAKEVLENDPF